MYKKKIVSSSSSLLLLSLLLLILFVMSPFPVIANDGNGSLRGDSSSKSKSESKSKSKSKSDKILENDKNNNSNDNSGIGHENDILNTGVPFPKVDKKLLYPSTTKTSDYWTDGLKNEDSLILSRGNIVYTKRDLNIPINAMYLNTPEDHIVSEHFWEIRILDIGTANNDYGSDNIWVGLTTRDGFDQGYMLRGYMYGGPGNIGDGISLKIGSYGPHSIRDNDKIGILAVTQPMNGINDENELKITFYHNDQCLGPAFHIKDRKFHGILFPVVSFQSPGMVSITSKNPPPISHRQREDENNNNSNNIPSLEGTWVLSMIDKNPLKDVEKNAAVLTVEKNEFNTAKDNDHYTDSYRLMIKVANIIRTTLFKVENNDITNDNNDIDTTATWTSNNVVTSTLMMNVFGTADLEENIKKTLGECDTFEIENIDNDFNHLKLSSPETELIFKRSSIVPRIVAEDVFDDENDYDNNNVYPSFDDIQISTSRKSSTNSIQLKMP